MAGEGFFVIVLALADFVVAVGKAPATDTEAEIRVRREHTVNAEFPIQIDRRDGQAQGKIRGSKAGPVQVVISISTQGRMALDRLLVARLDQVPPYWIDLALE